MINIALPAAPVTDPPADAPAVAAAALAPVEWRISDAPVDYPAALAAMEARVAAIAAGTAPELVWLLEHPPLYTAGTSARAADLLDSRFPVYPAGRGGQFTYHGPGQRVAYVMLDLRRRKPDVRWFVASLEAWIVGTLARLNIRGETRDGRVGVWVARPERGDGREDKIAAIGVRLKRWVSLHGISLNVDPDLSHFGGIVPCGIADPRYGVTSLWDLGHLVEMPEVDTLLKAEFETVFGPVRPLPGAPPEMSAPARDFGD
ncbi:lipoyl(octanoyl) transferase LipB [Rhodoplanes sp. TEM]|uniref:Octanoyltransferase n=1 Tax=Rhodoplanes tepidamans TaxID=200616 RepID=A0ABT5JDU2_RHOTP|nr:MULTISPECIES: lipoyl(octanoyl) transferase LipB [Rhodoplanes]MDC7787811.1 lipoyl(octanoyl) transferase LipB [Rhodoplanes tepidamans]MDC7987425.1 lipoyl(octanoyl) transferase LipB [Rhodoplanes sp. TEM]MDQ0357727.1 lipoyl(octanoyl) transferase [Rhodoplanes tepidamans]